MYSYLKLKTTGWTSRTVNNTYHQLLLPATVKTAQVYHFVNSNFTTHQDTQLWEHCRKAVNSLYSTFPKVLGLPSKRSPPSRWQLGRLRILGREGCRAGLGAYWQVAVECQGASSTAAGYWACSSQPGEGQGSTWVREGDSSNSFRAGGGQMLYALPSLWTAQINKSFIGNVVTTAISLSLGTNIHVFTNTCTIFFYFQTQKFMVYSSFTFMVVIMELR